MCTGIVECSSPGRSDMANWHNKRLGLQASISCQIISPSHKQCLQMPTISSLMSTQRFNVLCNFCWLKLHIAVIVFCWFLFSNCATKWENFSLKPDSYNLRTTCLQFGRKRIKMTHACKHLLHLFGHFTQLGVTVISFAMFESTSIWGSTLHQVWMQIWIHREVYISSK